MTLVSKIVKLCSSIKWKSIDVFELTKFYILFRYNFKEELIITCRGGLYVMGAKNRVEKIWNSGLFFGAEFFDNELYLYQDFRHFKVGVIWSIKSGKRKRIFKLVNSGVHQIRAKDNVLYVVNTYKNALDLYDIKLKFRIKRILPNHELSNGRLSDNYNHFNSILIVGELMYLLAHNNSVKSGKSSELYVIQGEDVVKIHDLGMKSAHDLYILDDVLLINDSIGSKGLFDFTNGRTIYNIEGFNRGIGFHLGQIVLGVSKVASRHDRDGIGNSIQVLSKKGELVSSFSIDSSPHDIVRTYFP